MAIQARKRANLTSNRRRSEGHGRVYPFASLLYATPSFLAGFASVLDLGGTLATFNESLSVEQADYLALLSDHRAVSADCRGGLAPYISSQAKQP